MGDVLRRGVERGELRADLDVELAIDALTGPWVYRLLIAGGDADAIYSLDPAALLDLVLPRDGGSTGWRFVNAPIPTAGRWERAPGD